MGGAEGLDRQGYSRRRCRHDPDPERPGESGSDRVGLGLQCISLGDDASSPVDQPFSLGRQALKGTVALDQ